ncbi:cupin domain-containing protein [Hwanghaeella grinnelliae]|uniref:Cupin domain-containing protein n=1 Tax=Hwanghaeella grinnelliae TaxID=2500179 RepID=A0A3S2VQC0_9PROT|nr:cupin domain-containing protein [Hwanghaeella grinnelliae]RVU36532.1 cupin domain-containing protein [Hwanghaeella grinnelliae]
MTADDVIRQLDLQPHPEGGWFREVFRHAAPDGGRGLVTSIYYLLKTGERSHWHRVTDAEEIWHFHAGAPLRLRIAAPEGSAENHILGMNLPAEERPQAVVPTGWWQSAETTGEWTLVGCTVAPAFDFAGFEMASPGWEPAAG